MKYPFQTRRTETGSSLVVAVFIIALLGVFVGLAYDYTSNTARVTMRAATYSKTQAMANGALDIAYKSWSKYMAGSQGSTNPTTRSMESKLLQDRDTQMAAINATLQPRGYFLQGFRIVAVSRADVEKPPGLTKDDYSTIPLPDTPGWFAKAYTYRATATVLHVVNPSLSPTSPDYADIKISVSRYFQTLDATLFQAMLFYQNDLELHPGAAMTLYGRVHTNSNFYAATSASLNFASNVSYHGDASSLNPYSNYKYKIDTGYVEGITAALYKQEGSTWNNYNAPVYATSRSSQLANVGNLSPIGTDVTGAIDNTNPNASGTHEIIERPVPVSATNPTPNNAYKDPAEYSAHRIYNTPNSLRVFINHSTAYSTSGGGKAQNIHVYKPVGDSDADLANSVEIIPGDGTKSKPLNVANSIIDAINVDGAVGDIYEFREGRAINASTLDMSKLTPALNTYSNTNPDYSGVLYITDITNVDSNGNSGNSDGIRIKKGGVLPDIGLTIASDGPVYIQGDYNTGTTYLPDLNGAVVPLVSPVSNLNLDPTQYTVPGYTQKPSAIMGDAVMILSNAWLDSNSNLALSTRNATPTTINTAIVSGDVLTTSAAESGGAHNFPRFLEGWGGKNFTYHGSMVELYGSTKFTGTYGKGNVYGAPNRRWFFDDSFLITQPPGNLRSTSYTRGRWVRNDYVLPST